MRSGRQASPTRRSGPGRLRVALERRENVHLDRVFVPEGVEWPKGARDRHRRQQLPHRMKLDHDVDFVADGVANFFERKSAALRSRRAIMVPAVSSAACRTAKFSWR